jgi:tetratricopeptide (TPR) repeat protein
MSFEQALADGDLDAARTRLDELARLPETGGLYMPECYSDLAQSFGHQRRYDDAITAMERAIEHGWNGRPDGRSDIAEFHLRAGRAEQAAEIWAQLKSEEPGDVWLYNAAGLSYSEIGEHQLAISWLGEGIELAIGTGDPEGIVAQLSDVRRRSLHALGQEEHDELERRADPFLEQWRAREREHSRPPPLDPPETPMTPPDASTPPSDQNGNTAIALSWFPHGEYEQAIARWPSLAEDWADTPHADYSRHLDGHIKWMRTNGIRIRAIAPIVVYDFLAWCEEHDKDPEQARAQYAAQLLIDGKTIPWPPSRNDPCWCGSQRKYKRCCGPAPPAAMHPQEHLNRR